MVFVIVPLRETKILHRSDRAHNHKKYEFLGTVDERLYMTRATLGQKGSILFWTSGTNDDLVRRPHWDEMIVKLEI